MKANLLKNFTSLSTLTLALSSSPAFADDTVKSILGGIVGSIIVEGVKEAGKSQQENAEVKERIEWVEQAPEPIIRSNPRVNEIQTYLSRIQFYEGIIDGIPGAGTDVAIRRWEAAFEQTIDGNISDDELTLLKTASEGGFQSSSTFEAAQKLGISSAREYSKLRYTESEQFLQIAESFSKSYQGELNVSEITSELKELHGTEEYNWQADSERAFKKVKEFYADLEGFEEFYNAQIAISEQKEEAVRISLLDEIDRVDEFSREHLRNNITSENAIGLSDKLQKLGTAEAKNLSLDNLRLMRSDVFDILRAERLQSEYDRWKNEKYPEVAAIESDSLTVALEAAGTQSENISEGSTKKAGSWSKLFNFSKDKKKVATEKFEIEILGVRTERIIGEGAYYTVAPQGASYAIVRYSIKNISDAPVSLWSFPVIHLLDHNGNRHSADVDGTLAYASESSTDATIVTNLNLSNSFTYFQVFEVSDDQFDIATWSVDIEADKDANVPLSLFQ